MWFTCTTPYRHLPSLPNPSRGPFFMEFLCSSCACLAFLFSSSVWPVTPGLVRALHIARCPLISRKKFPQLSIWTSPNAQSKRRAEETHRHTCTNVHNVHRQLHRAVTAHEREWTVSAWMYAPLRVPLSVLLCLLVSSSSFPFPFLGGTIVTWLKHTQLILPTPHHCIWLTSSPGSFLHHYQDNGKHTHTHTHVYLDLAGVVVQSRQVDSARCWRLRGPNEALVKDIIYQRMGVRKSPPPLTVHSDLVIISVKCKCCSDKCFNCSRRAFTNCCAGVISVTVKDCFHVLQPHRSRVGPCRCLTGMVRQPAFHKTWSR